MTTDKGYSELAMTTPNYSCPSADGDRFVASEVNADAITASHVRHKFSSWLGCRADIDATRFSDIVLAVNEAMANAAEFAYAHVGGIGKFDVEAVQDGHSRILTVTVSDQGRWRHSDSTEEKRTRGRGIPLMQMLAEDVTIDHSPLGTIVCLRFENVHSRSYGPVVQEVF